MGNIEKVPTAGGGSDGDDGRCVVAGCDSTESSQCVGRAGWHAMWWFIDGGTETELVVVVAVLQYEQAMIDAMFTSLLQRYNVRHVEHGLPSGDRILSGVYNSGACWRCES